MNSEEEQIKKRAIDYTVNVQMITFISNNYSCDFDFS